MDDDAQARVYRVTVRGRFNDLSEESRRYLVTSQSEHDIFNSGYTTEGTFTYDSRIDYFNFRYEVRVTGEELQNAAGEFAIRETESFLRTMSFGYRDLKVEVVDMSAMWADPRITDR